MNEILLIFDTCKQSVNYLRDLADELCENKIDVKLNKRDLTLQTETNRITAISMTGSDLFLPKGHFKYYLNFTREVQETFYKRIGWTIPPWTKEINESKLISILIGGMTNGF